MPDSLATAGACFLLWLGFALLALSQERHWDHVCASPAPPARLRPVQRATAFLAIGGALPMCVAAEGAGFGSLLWLVLVGAAALSVALMLTWRPQWLGPLARCMLFFGTRRP